MTHTNPAINRGAVIQGKFLDGRPRFAVAAPPVRRLTPPMAGVPPLPRRMPPTNRPLSHASQTRVGQPTRAQRQEVHAPLNHQAARLQRMAQAHTTQPRAVGPPVMPPLPATHPGAVVQRMGHGDAFPVPPHVSFGGGGGQPLPAPVRQKMEACFGTSFADVRVHVGPQASSIGALAFTQGAHLYFAPGQYNPHTPQGQQILGHELAHVVQQRAGRVRNPFGAGVAVVQDHRLEAEADRMGCLAARHPATHTTATIQRAPTRAAAHLRPHTHPIPRTPHHPTARLRGHIIQRKCELCGKAHETDACPQFKGFQQQLTTTSTWTVEKVQQAVIEDQARYVASKIRNTDPIAAINYTTVQQWADWYFSGLEYQNNKTGGWHENRHNLLTGGPTPEGSPTRYVEFRRPGATYGVKDYTKLERCIFDLYTYRVYPNAHYDKGYVEITNIPLPVKRNLWNLAITAHDAVGRYQQAQGMQGSPTDKIKHVFQIQ